MDVLLVSILYLAVALLVGLYTYFRGIMARPMPHIFSAEDRAVVVLASAAVGLIWILFTPVMLVRWTFLAYRWAEEKWNRLLVRLPRVARLWS